MDAATGTTGSPAESQVCLKCGLCCTGAIFDYAPLEADEVKFLVSGQFTRWQGKRGFAFPCAHLDGACCSSYDNRPKVCRRYRCEVLVNLGAGKLDQAKAEGLVTRASDLVRAALAAAPEPSVTIAELRRAFQSGQDGWAQATPAQRAAMAPLRLALAALERHLDAHFRRPHQRQMAELPAATAAVAAQANPAGSGPARKRLRAGAVSRR